MRVLRTAHLGPTLLVTFIAYFLALQMWWEGPAYVIAFTIFTGQLCVGWTNDLVDQESDQAQGRKNKPLANGEVSREAIKRLTFLSLFICVLFSIFGPLGIAGGLFHLLGVGFGVAYNFYFKSMWLSPLPYAVGFAALPGSIVLSKSSTLPLWVLAVGALAGVSAHFINGFKDMENDRSAGMLGLPQILGTRKSIFVTILLLISVALIILNFGDVTFLHSFSEYS
ncbi:MAG: hypothetical protein F2704_00320 [Actinobacteria bacterium]|uniref:Unannotated protein n=1 Tax=freshwater metagenome TaxID=449393 RepID=A0A6J6SWX2_9ZZZZ|nr:hypothetical protein [Actinomycetota bacterium]MSX24244.1 hypothetical protein [Actinomycetota bacterium]MSY47027.1 hypothetical protein [Actinomycetota bacterium]MSY56697.1 hypothetical protein [Actinomycetota bacterium]MTB00378.1 hypothetical protein [Actinomycetota bacterium]